MKKKMLTLRQDDERLKTRRTIFSGLNEDTDLLVAALGEMGLSTKAIASKTGLSEGQVIYRLGFAGVRRADYRSGESKSAAIVEKAVLGTLLHLSEKQVSAKFKAEENEL